MLLNTFSNLSISKAGVLALTSQKSWGAHFELETDIRAVFPYVNAVIPDARYHNQPEYVLFLFDGIHCTLYPRDIIAASFSGRESAIAFFKKLIDFLNDLYSRRDEIVPNYRKYQPVSVIEIYKLLPKSNCRECGYPTCLAFAGAMRLGNTTPDQCPGFASSIYEYAVYPIYDNNGRLTSTVTIEKDRERRKEMPDRATEIHKIEFDPDEADDASETKIGHPPLTDREKEVLKLVAGGSTNNEISKMLSISPHTVKSHVIHIFNKLGVNDRTQAAVIAAQKNLLHNIH